MDIKTFAPELSPFNTNRIGLAPGCKIAVIGAGSFGGWASLYLRRKGFDVTLIDAWGAGNSRSTSGDETRVIRSTYGANEFYFDLNVRALQLWKEHQQRWNRQVFYNCGVIWTCYQENNPIVDDSIPFASKHKMEYEYITTEEIKKRFPLIETVDLHHAWFDPFGGYLKARESCQLVSKTFVEEGGKMILAYALPDVTQVAHLSELKLTNGEKVNADAYLFACGPWLGKMFPFLNDKITCTKQEAYYFGVPPDKAEAFNNLPCWIDLDGDDFYYGIPGNANRGFKIGVDRRGKIFDPTNSERILNPEVLAKARKFIGHRFPDLKNAPLTENRVCPYENSPDGNFIFEKHPAINNIWVLGGGSGHGFKHGPALGELIANLFA
jgi:glycine/D-amino acid oxidase-like deaminating enzyme